MRVDLVWLGESDPPEWAAGQIRRCAAFPSELHEASRAAAQTAATWTLFWSDALGAPDPSVGERLSERIQVVHCGLALGMQGLPRSLQYIDPTWMLRADADPGIESSSWRMSFDAACVHSSVLKQVGPVDAGFSSLAGASLEFGHRCVKAGVVMRHVPWLVEEPARGQAELSIEDDLLFASKRFGPKWVRWSFYRGLRTKWLKPSDVWHHRKLTKTGPATIREAFDHPVRPSDRQPSGSVGVLVPTIGRYPYLRVLLEQLGHQTVPPVQVVVVDQTPTTSRERIKESDYPDLPLEVLTLEKAGQCTARNAGLDALSAEFVLFLDDDDEIDETLIASHLQAISRFECTASSGVVDEAGALPLSASFKRRRVGDVFPTNNSLVRREAIEAAGRFDIAFDKGQRADHDLGMRVYLNGGLLMLDPEICVLHHHAPVGGLRTHGARRVTYSSSRTRLLHHNLPTTSEIYLAHKYYDEASVKEMLVLRTFGTLSLRGSKMAQLLKALVGGALLIKNWRTAKLREREAFEWLRDPRLQRGETR